MAFFKPEDRDQMWALGRVGTIGLELGASIAVGYFGGQWLDGRFDTTPVLTWVGLAVGIAAGFKTIFEARAALLEADRRAADKSARS